MQRGDAKGGKRYDSMFHPPIANTLIKSLLEYASRMRMHAVLKVRLI